MSLFVQWKEVGLMKIDIDKISKLSKISIPQDKRKMFETKMNEIMDMIDSLPKVESFENSVDIGRDNIMILRNDDVAKDKLDRDQLLENSKSVKAGCFVVPNVMD